MAVAKTGEIGIYEVTATIPKNSALFPAVVTTFAIEIYSSDPPPGVGVFHPSYVLIPGTR